MKSAVYEHTDAEFDRCYNDTADKTAQDKAVCLHVDIDNINQQKGNTARYRHRPMCISSRNNLDEAVYNRAEAENRKVFAEFCFSQHKITLFILPEK